MITAMNVGQIAREFIEYQTEVHGVDPDFWADNIPDLDIVGMWAENAAPTELGLLALAVNEHARASRS